MPREFGERVRSDHRARTPGDRDVDRDRRIDPIRNSRLIIARRIVRPGVLWLDGATVVEREPRLDAPLAQAEAAGRVTTRLKRSPR